MEISVTAEHDLYKPVLKKMLLMETTNTQARTQNAMSQGETG